MDRIDTPRAMQAWSAARHADGSTIAMVPTMGALHDGHLSLMRAGLERCDVVVASIFVNPLQFNRPDDFQHYPRTIERDLELCAEVGVAAVYAPTPAVMYPPGFQTHVEPGQLAATLEGLNRPGHFRGVTTVVTKLFNAVRPDVALFGLKDFQQLAIIKQMVADLDMGIDVAGMETVRELGGLAMSSRNGRLTAAQRTAAEVVPGALDAVEGAIASGETRISALRDIAATAIAAEPLARLEYIELVDPNTLTVVDGVDHPLLATLAVWFGDVRLIDNRLIVNRAAGAS